MLAACLSLCSGPVLAAETVLSARFETGSDGFVFLEDAFLETAAPDHASGIWRPASDARSGVLSVVLGAPVRETVRGMSAAWLRRFTTARPLEHLRVRLRCRLTLASGFEGDEFGQLMVQLDDSWVAAHGLDYVDRLSGDGDGGEDTTTGWIVFALDMGVLPAGPHVLRVGAYVNKKTAADETFELLIDEVEISGTARDD